MNKLKYTGVLGIVLVLMISCAKEKLMRYDIKDNIYFRFGGTTGAIADSTDVTFAYAPLSVKDSLFAIPVLITGTPSDHDRTFKIIIVDTLTTAVEGTHYVMPTSLIVHAGRIQDSLRIKLLRSADMQTKTIRLGVALVESNDFQVNIESIGSNISQGNVVRFKMKISDQLVKSLYWDGIFSAFGTFSVKKVRLINQITGMPLDYVNTGWFPDLYVNTRVAYIAITMARYLRDQKAAGNTVYEDDGVTEMKMGVAYQ